MRIIAGTYRGFRLQAPKGDKTRPTTDRVKESVMSALENAKGGFEGARVLDAFAGSGSLGLEILSRGGAFCHFCENDVQVLKVLKRNIENVGISCSTYRITRDDTLKTTFAGQCFDVVLFDPPYKTPVNSIQDFLVSLYKRGSLLEEALILYEHSEANGSLPEQLSDELQCSSVFHKRYGDTVVDIVCVVPERS